MDWPAQDKDLSAPLRGGKVFFVYRKDSASGFGEYLGHDLPAIQALFQGVEVHANGTYRRENVLPTAKRRNLCKVSRFRR